MAGMGDKCNCKKKVRDYIIVVIIIAACAISTVRWDRESFDAEKYRTSMSGIPAQITSRAPLFLTSFPRKYVLGASQKNTTHEVLDFLKKFWSQYHPK